MDNPLGQPPYVERLPITIGVYYSDEFRRYVHEEKIAQTTYRFDLGDANITLWSLILSSLFERVEELPGPYITSAQQSHLSAVFQPEIEGFTGIAGEPRIAYKFTLRSPSGELIASWSETGFSHRNVHIFNLGSGARMAMRGAAAKFLVNFGKEPKVRQWLMNQDAIRPKTKTISS